MKLISAVLLLLIASSMLTPATSTHPYTAEQYEAFEEICMDLLDTPPAYRAKFKDHQYPDDPITHRHFYCLGLINGGFDPKQERLNVDRIYAQYGAGVSLQEFRQRCDKCERQARAEAEDRYELAFRLYECFEEQFLEIFEKRNSAGLSCQQLETIERICMDLYEVPRGTRKQFERKEYRDTEESRRHLFCGGLVGGFYSVEDGFNKDKLYAALEPTESLKVFKARMEKCFWRVGYYEEGIAHGEKIYRAYQCIEEDRRKFMGC